MSRINMSIYSKTLENIATIKRNFRNSFNTEVMSLSVKNTDTDDNDFTDVSYHMTTNHLHDDMNDTVKVTTRLHDETFALSINSTDNDNSEHVMFTLFINEDVRKAIVNSLENVIVNKKDDE